MKDQIKEVEELREEHNELYNEITRSKITTSPQDNIITSPDNRVTTSPCPRSLHNHITTRQDYHITTRQYHHINRSTIITSPQDNNTTSPDNRVTTSPGPRLTHHITTRQDHESTVSSDHHWITRSTDHHISRAKIRRRIGNPRKIISQVLRQWEVSGRVWTPRHESGQQATRARYLRFHPILSDYGLHRKNFNNLAIFALSDHQRVASLGPQRKCNVTDEGRSSKGKLFTF